MWKTDFKVLRDYLGEAKTFEVFIKTNMVFLFMFLVPFGIGGELIYRNVVSTSTIGLFPEFIFNLIYLFITVVFYAIFIEKYQYSEKSFRSNFVEKNPLTEFRNDYEGPYTRNVSNDNSNNYDEGYARPKDYAFRVLNSIIIFIMFGAIVGFYYGIRFMIITLSQVVPVDEGAFYLFKAAHLIGYSIFFVVNTILYSLTISPISNYLTRLENRPTEEAFSSAVNAKLYFFALGIELIGPIDLVYIQSAAKT